MRGQINPAMLGRFMKMLQAGTMPKVAASRKKASKRSKKKQAAPKDEAAIEENRLRNNELVVEAFTKAGYSDVQPRINVLTYGKWEEQGRRVRKGEKSVRVGNFNLFHISQCDVVGGDEQKEQVGANS